MLTRSNRIYQRNVYSAHNTEAEAFEAGKTVQLEADQEKVKEMFEKIEELDRKVPGYITFEEALKHPEKDVVITIYLGDYQALKERWGVSVDAKQT